MESLESQLIAELKKRKLMLITAESCTGGLIAHRITNISGSSEVFWGAAVVYANDAKALLAHVSSGLIVKHGAVSAEVAQALAEGVLQHHKAGVAIATTGIAGPTGGTPQKPVGLCYIAASGGDKPTLVRELRAPSTNSREQNKTYFAEEAMKLLLEHLR